MQGEAFNGGLLGSLGGLSEFNREVTIVFLSDFKFSLSEHVRFLIMMCSLKMFDEIIDYVVNRGFELGLRNPKRTT